MAQAAAASAPDVAPIFVGPDHAEVDLLRPSEGFPRVYVQAELPDGELGVFLVDTGADVSVITAATAERLGLTGQETRVSGMSGSATTSIARLPWLRVGAMTVPEVDVVLGVSGFGETAEFMPIEGLLGNNVWGRFTLELDYPANLLLLHRPGTVDLPRKAPVMLFDGHHVYTPVTVTSKGRTAARDTIVTQIDTGAGPLFVCAATGLPFAGDHTEGIDTVRGIGASETLPPYRFLEKTRHIPLATLELGGKRLDAEGHAAHWLYFERTHTDSCPANFAALLGHEFLDGRRVVFDYAGGRFSVSRSRRAPRFVNGHARLLEQDLARHGDDVGRSLFRAELLFGAGRIDEAVQLLATTRPPDPADDARRLVLLARAHRFHGDIDKAWEALSGLPAGRLVDEEEIVGAVNGLIFEGRADEAMSLAVAAVAERPDEGAAWVARADVHLSRGDGPAAAADLHRAASLEGYHDAHLLRRARVALAEGDRYGAMSHVRRLVQLYPMFGQNLWFYAMLVKSEAEAATFRSDLEEAMARLHPHQRPLDFLVAAHHALGDDLQTRTVMAEGIHQHCEPMDGPLRDNCRAWYYALAGANPEEALLLIERALAATGDRSDFLDTKAMVHLSRGELERAFAAAHEAARLSPDDVYMLWQAERIGDLFAEAAGVVGSPADGQRSTAARAAVRSDRR